MRTVTRIERRIVLKDGDCRFDGVQRVPAVFQYGPSCLQRPEATRFAGLHGGVGNIPRTTMNN